MEILAADMIIGETMGGWITVLLVHEGVLYVAGDAVVVDVVFMSVAVVDYIAATFSGLVINDLRVFSVM